MRGFGSHWSASLLIRSHPVRSFWLWTRRDQARNTLGIIFATAMLATLAVLCFRIGVEQPRTNRNFTPAVSSARVIAARLLAINGIAGQYMLL
jgi:hypothetical protein